MVHMKDRVAFWWIQADRTHSALLLKESQIDIAFDAISLV